MAPQLVDTKLIAVDDLTPHPDNPNRGDVDAIVESMENFGQYRAIVVNQNGVIIAGHHVWEAARRLNYPQILCNVVQADETETLRMLLADNRLAERGEGNDLDRLLAALEKVAQDNEDAFLGTGYDTDYLAMLHEAAAGPPDLDDLGDEAGPSQEDDYHTKIVLVLDPRVASIWQDYRKEHMNDTAAMAKLLQPKAVSAE